VGEDGARAAAASHRSWFRARAEATGGAVRTRAGGLLAHAPEPDGPGRVDVLLGTPARGESAAVADELLEWIPLLPPLYSVGWWAAGAGDGALAATLLARGFQWGWQPHWMVLDVGRPTPDVPPPPGIALLWGPAVPGPAGAAPLPADRPPGGAPAATSVLSARAGRDVVGHVTLHVGGRFAAATGAPLGGLYDCHVEPDHRRRGIGTALAATAAARARALGCRLVTLNATPMGEPVYARVGFRSAGHGQTWWLRVPDRRPPRPEADLVRLVEAVGAADAAGLDAAVHGLRSRPGGFDPDAPLPCGEPPLAVAARLGRPEAARWLLGHGASLDVVTAWDLGWRKEAADLLRARPELANLRTGEAGATPLMVAVERDDADLARLVLGAGPDLSLRDLRHAADALGWAEHLGRTALADLIRGAGGARAGP
jgi:GNAT superfamily N-acetyltransferase